jgi:type I site-specific restriction-modification system R (restriction) subunit
LKRTGETAFETAIEAVLLADGYIKIPSTDFDRERAIFAEVALEFIQETQIKTWEKLEALHGDETSERVLQALCKWLGTHGVLTTLRHGFKYFGKTLRIAFFRPAHGLNPDLEAHYRANRLGLTRQLHFSPKSEKSLDVVLSVNGIPVVTLELKIPLSGQTVANGIHQYRHDRDPRELIFQFTKRALVHFAVDTEEVHMTTRLAGTSTHFLPFNRGNEGGAGNEPDKAGRNYKTAYLWEEVLSRDSLLDLLARFLHLDIEEKVSDTGKKVRKETMIFPRYHQLQAVRQIVAAVGVEGVGHSYLPTRKYAVIIDEAHSSQSGETATELKSVLGGAELLRKAREAAQEEGEEELERLFRAMAKRGHQPNMSFFAFTATPKHKTLAIFGRNKDPFHRYTMRQAIEEGFIEDVLKNYVTYKTYYKLSKKAEDDPNVERKKAARALARFMRLHPHNIGQKTEVMVEHFQQHSRHKIGGQAKAMVVTGSRLEAVRYKQEFDRYIQVKGYPIKSLVAFSGTVEDDKVPEKTYTEVGMNCGVKEKELPATFAKLEYRVLLVAEKYQTGFDQPLLHTMYVDKRLAGIQAVQTLSRLNRTHPLKDDTFVLDFVNDPGEIQEAFRQYYEGSVMGEEVDPDRLYEVKAELDSSGIYLQLEVDDFAHIFFAPKRRQSPTDHKNMNAILDQAVARFQQLQSEEEEGAELWRG